LIYVGPCIFTQCICRALLDLRSCYRDYNRFQARHQLSQSSWPNELNIITIITYKSEEGAHSPSGQTGVRIIIIIIIIIITCKRMVTTGNFYSVAASPLRA
jgi:hypothetical protein